MSKLITQVASRNLRDGFFSSEKESRKVYHNAPHTIIG
ncbi:hypothetical protein D028_3141 [Vibrio parahaemolyticus 50]|nr:hypothetical protein D028_3141 [Vibrio parahaemolyticus 50]